MSRSAVPDHTKTRDVGPTAFQVTKSWKPFRHAWTLLSGLFLAQLVLLLALYLSVPVGHDERWAGRDRLPDQSVRVSALYRHAYGVPPVALSPSRFRLAHAIILVTLWLTYAGLLLLRPPRRWLVWTLTIGAVLIATLMPPLLSTDVFYYGITGEIAAWYGANPHITPPEGFPQSELLSYNYWIDFPSPYGPAWTSISAGIVSLTDGSPFAVSMLFKAFSAFCLVLCAVLPYNIVSRNDQQRALQAVLLFVCNPLVLLETAGNAHNDALTAVLVLVAALLLVRSVSVGSFLSLATAVVVKITILPAIALFIVGRTRDGTLASRGARILRFGGALLMLMVIAYVPYWEGLKTLQGLAGQPLGGIQGVVPAAVYGIGKDVASERAAILSAWVASAVAMSVILAWMARTAVKFWKLGCGLSPVAEIFAWGSVLTVVPLFFIRSYPWYTVSGLALLAAAWPHRTRVTLTLYAICGIWFLLRNTT